MQNIIRCYCIENDIRFGLFSVFVRVKARSFIRDNVSVKVQGVVNCRPSGQDATDWILRLPSERRRAHLLAFTCSGPNVPIAAINKHSTFASLKYRLNHFPKRCFPGRF